MCGRCFRGVVGEVALRVAHEAGHGGYDYDGRGGGGRGLEEGEEGDGGEVDGGDVGVEGFVPGGEGFGGPEFGF